MTRAFFISAFTLLLVVIGYGQGVRPDNFTEDYTPVTTDAFYTQEGGNTRKIYLSTLDSFYALQVYEKTTVSDTSTISGESRGDIMFNSTPDTLCVRGVYGWVCFSGGGGGSQTLSLSGDSLSISGGNTVDISRFGILTSAEGSLSAALAAVSSTRKTIIVNDAQTLSGNTTIPDSVTLMFVDHGQIDLNGDTLTLYGDIDAELQQIFVENSGVINGTPKTTTWFPEWFGAKTEPNSRAGSEASYDDHDAIQAAFNVLKNIGGGKLQLQAGNYHNLDACFVPDNTTIQGAGRDVTHIWASSTNTDLTVYSHPFSSTERFTHFYLGNSFFTDAAHNITARDFSGHCYDSQVGFEATGDTTTTIFQAEAVDASANALDYFKNVHINNVGAYDVTSIFGTSRMQGSEDPSNYNYNEALIIENCIIDTCSNKAIEIQETKNVIVRNNTIDRSEAGIQAIHFTKNMLIEGNHVTIGNGNPGGGETGILVSNSSDNIIVANNFVSLVSVDATAREGYPSALKSKHDQDSNVLSEWTEAHITDRVTISNNIFDVTNAGQDPVHGFNFSATAGAGSYLEKISNWTFSGNRWIGGAIKLDYDNSIKNECTAENLVFDGELIQDIICDSIEYTSNVVFRNCIIEGPDTTTVSDTVNIRAHTFLFQSCDIRAKLQFESSSTGNRLIGNIGIDTILSADSNIDTANFNIFVGVVNDTFLLDDYAGAELAVSLRKLRNGYSGDVIEVQRASDNTTQAIGFSGTYADTTSLLSFCSGTDCYVKTWYDQSGNSDNLTEADTADMPLIVTAGALTYLNNHPIIIFDGTDDQLATSGQVLTDPWSVFSVAASIDTTGSSTFMSQSDVSDATRTLLYLNRGVTAGGLHSGSGQVGGSGASGGSSADEELNINSWLRNGTTINIWRNGTQNVTSGTVGSGDSQNAALVLASQVSTSNFYPISMAEIIIYNAEEKTADRSGIETDMNEYYQRF